MVAPFTFIGLLALNALLQLADLWTTWIWVSDGGSEYNFVSRWMMEAGGFGLWGAAKLAIVGGIVYLAMWTRKQGPDVQQQVALIAAGAAAWMTFVVQSNVGRLTA